MNPIFWKNKSRPCGEGGERMCGIVGFAGTTVARERLLRACDLIQHRGPDSGGTFEDAGKQIALGFRRLAILDLSPQGHQPMTSADGSTVIVFNGEIYGYQALRRQLEGRYPFRSGTDTEVLLNGYLAWGIEGLLRRVQGMFAFALWDSREGKLYLARDRAGKKPLFYSTGSGLKFASTLPALLALMDRTPELDPAALDLYLTYMCVPQPRTIFSGVSKLPPAHYAVYDRSGLHLRRYWDLSFAGKEARSEAEWLEALDSELRRAVRDRLVSDVPVGALLSGGVDSGLVVSLMAQESSRRVTTVTCGFREQAFNELPYAAQVARRWETDHHEIVLEPGAWGILPELVWHFGEPFADPSMLPTYFVAKAARRYMTVVLNGDGGDESFGGYSRPVVARAAALYRSVVPGPLRTWVAPPVVAGLRHLLGDARSMRKVAMLVEAGRQPAREAFTYGRGFGSLREELYAPGFRRQLAGDPRQLYWNVWDRADGVDDVDRALYGDLVTYLPDQLLVKMDVTTMAHSLEARSPLLDTAVMELAARIPAGLKIRNFHTKYLLKRLAERYLPREVIYRRKQGFAMPIAQWLRGELGPRLKAVLLTPQAEGRGIFRTESVRRLIDEHLSGRADHAERLWTLLVLEVWFGLFVDGTLSRGDLLGPGV
jgi:asparagine synthase (glutamine-hydrolysing)